MKNRYKYFLVSFLLVCLLSCSSIYQPKKIADISLPKSIFHNKSKNELVVLESSGSHFWIINTQNLQSKKLNIQNDFGILRYACEYKEKIFMFDYENFFVSIDLNTYQQEEKPSPINNGNGCVSRNEPASKRELIVWTDTSYYLYTENFLTEHKVIDDGYITSGELDTNNAIFLGTSKGEVYYVSQNNPHPSLVLNFDSNVISIKNDKKNLWIATTDHLYQIDTNKFIKQSSFVLPQRNLLHIISSYKENSLLIFSNTIYEVLNGEVVEIDIKDYVSNGAVTINNDIYYITINGVYLLSLK